MKVIKDAAVWQKIRQKLKNKTVGFVPTMGALHQGHISLVAQSKRENDITVVSIFVNPTQFNDKNDLKKYPRDFAKDKKILEKAGADFVLLPDYKAIYPDNYVYRITENKISKVLCGKSRPGHFEGVLTIVMKLLNIADADKAYFGEKDYQQYLLVKELARTFFVRTKIVSAPIVREADGLAMSSRNARLLPEHRAAAPLFYAILKTAKSAGEAKKSLVKAGFEVDYVERRWGRLLGAVKLGSVRLIDNVKR